jgi:hypothetical protein
MMSYPLANDDYLGWIDFGIRDPQVARTEARRVLERLEKRSVPPAVVWVAAPDESGAQALFEELSSAGFRRDRGGSLNCVFRYTRPAGTDR